jgi:uncharacterized protein (DUF2062 family)
MGFKNQYRIVWIKRLTNYLINDTPQKIAQGLGLGVFLGILPATGPIAALFLAFVLKVNRTAALLGSLLTNTWLSIVTFLLSIKIGSSIMRLDWCKVQNNWRALGKDFRWFSLFKASVLNIILPVVLGYFIVALLLGLTTYIISLLVLTYLKDKNNPVIINKKGV